MDNRGRRAWRPSTFAWATAVALAAAALLLFAAHRSSRTMAVVSEVNLTADQYVASMESPDPIPVGRRSSPLLVSYDAPVDQSWVFLECQLVGADDRIASEFFIQLEYYHGTLDGQFWEKGSARGEKMVQLKGDGPYRLRVKGSGGYGDDPPSAGDPPRGPPVRVRFLTGIPATRALTWGAVLAALAGVAFFLRALRPPSPASAVSISPNSPASKPRLLFLDGLRGVAVLSVLFCHFLVPEISAIAEPLQQALGKPLAALFRHGDLGVEIFFVLSGFVISYTVLGQEITPAYTGRFVARRAVRLDPPYYVALLIMLTVVAMEHHDGLFGAWRQFGGWDTALINMFYLQDLLHRPTPLDISWSLCLEIQFYLAFIFICFLAQLMQRTGRVGKSSQLLLLLPLIGFSLYCWYPHANRFDFFGTWFRFGLGALACLVFTKRVSPRWLHATLAAVAIPAILCQDLRGLAAAATAISIHHVGRTGRLTTWLSGPVIQFFGRISYSMYLLHLAAGIFVVNLIWGWVDPTPANALLLVPVGIVTAMLGSLLLYVLFERPSVTLGHRIRKAGSAKPRNTQGAGVKAPPP